MIKTELENGFRFEVEPQEVNGLIYYNPFEFKIYLIATQATDEAYAVFAQLVARNNVCVNSKVITFGKITGVEKLQVTLSHFLRSEIFDLGLLVNKYESQTARLQKRKQ